MAVEIHTNGGFGESVSLQEERTPRASCTTSKIHPPTERRLNHLQRSPDRAYERVFAPTDQQSFPTTVVPDGVAALRRLALPVTVFSAAISDFSCIAEGDEEDLVAQNVNGFLVDKRFEPGLRHGISATYLLIDIDKKPPVLGYATLTFDSVRLTNSEKKRMENLVGISEFGAVRIHMIGVDHRHQRTHCRAELLEGITGLTRKLSDEVAVRSCSPMRMSARSAGTSGPRFVRNQAKRETERLDPERSISMRLDLLEGLRGEGPAG